MRKLRIMVAVVLGLGLPALIAAALPALAAPLTPQAALDVVVSEIAWMGTTTSSNDEWIELYNTTGSPIDLTGWTLSAADGTPSIVLNGTIPAGGYFLLERTDDDTVPGVPADQIYTGALSNDGEDLVLRDGGSNIIDQIDCSGGWFSGHSDGRVPMVRVSATISGNLASNWAYNPRCGTATNSMGISHTCVLTVTNVGYTLDYSVYFDELTTTAMTVTTDHTPMEDALLALIDGATTSVDAAIYGLNRQSVVDALIDAHGRGVTVRVVGDDDAATGDYSTSYQALIGAGIMVITDTSSYIQHNKIVIIDGQIVWTGSTNLTDTGFTLNANNSIAITDTTLAGVYTTEFEEMWAGSFHNAKSDNTPHIFDYAGTRLESFFSPTDLVAFDVWDELAGADETVHFAMFFWTDDLLTDRVIERLDAGVEVYGVWDQLGAASPYSSDEALSSAGAQIRIEDFPGKVHHKFAVIDVEGSDPTVILGSYNWTDSGAYDNDENTLIIHDYDLAQVYYAEWLRLWLALGPGTGELYVASSGTDIGSCTNSDFPCKTIQYAVDQAGEDSTIKVASGIYTGVQGRLASPGYGGPSVITQVVYLSKTVTIQGGYTTTNWTTPDPEAHPTTLDAQGNGRVLFVTGNITPTIAGLHITGGNAAMLGGGGPSLGDDAGDGVYVITATVILNNNWVFDNTATPSLCAYGGGLYFQSSSATLSGNKVFSNTGCVGGGVLVYNSTAVLDANTVFSNTGFQTGGGLSLANSVVTLTGNIVSSNTGYYGGGGVLVYESNATLNGNTITSNIITGDNSGGVALVRSNSTLNGNTIACNTSSGTGGGVGFFEGTATLINNVIADNRTNWAGGGIYVSDASADLLHNTVVRNVGGDGAGIYVTNNSTVAMTNTILVSHTVGITVAAGSTVALEGTLWGSGAWANTTDWGGPGTIITGTSAYNYWSDPAFVNPNAGDYHIRSVSAALNAGIDAGVTEDIDGDPRSDGYPDIGADELGVGLSVTKRAYPRAVEAGARLTYTIRVTNTGSADLHAVITDTLPLSVTLGGMLSGTVLLPGRTVVLPDGMVGITWTASITAPGSVWMETVVVTVEMGYSGLLTNVVEVTTEESATGIYIETVVAGQRSIYLPLVLRNR